MSYQAWSVVFGEQPSAAKWNILGSNDSSFNDGTGIASLEFGAGHTTAKIDNKFRIYRSASYSTTGTNSFIRMPYDTKNYDTNSLADISTNPGRVTMTAAGFYLLGSRYGTGSAASNINDIALFKNGSEISRGNILQYTANPMGNIVTDFLQFSVNDFVESYYSTNGSVVADVGSAYNYFWGVALCQT